MNRLKKIYVAFLKGINVGGHKKIKMQDLKELFIRLGLHHVSTYIQSGNVVFSLDQSDAAHLQNQIESALKETYGFEVKVLLRTAAEIQQVIVSNPFLEEESVDVSQLYVTLLSKVPEQEERERLLAFSFPQEEYRILDKTVYLNCLNGYGNTKMSNDFFEKKLKQHATTRNWRTMLKMQEMCKDLDQI